LPPSSFESEPPLEKLDITIKPRGRWPKFKSDFERKTRDTVSDTKVPNWPTDLFVRGRHFLDPKGYYWKLRKYYRTHDSFAYCVIVHDDPCADHAVHAHHG
jgi:hypothetical protein